MSERLNMGEWTPEEEAVLTQFVLEDVRKGKTQLGAFKRAGKELNRTTHACSLRFYDNIRPFFMEELEQAKKEAKYKAREIPSIKVEEVPVKQQLLEWERLLAERESRLHKGELEEVKNTVVAGVSADEPRVTNAKGGSQSASLYRMDLLDPKALLATAKVLKEGADKYGAENWRLLDMEDHLNHLIIHVYAYLAGDKSDEHLSHVACRALFALGVSLQTESDLERLKQQGE